MSIAIEAVKKLSMRENRSEDQPQDPNGLVHLSCGRNDYEAGKSDNACYSTHDESNKHADDNLFHDIPLRSAISLLESELREASVMMEITSS